MKMKRGCLFLLFVFAVVLFTNGMRAEAMHTGFQTDLLSDEKQNRFISNIDIELIGKEPSKKTIQCFDVNNNHLIAIGHGGTERKAVCVYSDDGIFQYGYTFNCSGDFGVEWDEENLNIYFVRSDVIVSVAPNGEVLDVLEVKNTVDNNSYVNHFMHSTKRSVGETEYVIDNYPRILNLVTASYSQLIVKDENGTEITVYDAGSMQLFNVIITAVVVGTFIAMAVSVIVYQIKMKTKRNDANTEN